MVCWTESNQLTQHDALQRGRNRGKSNLQLCPLMKTEAEAGKDCFGICTCANVSLSDVDNVVRGASRFGVDVVLLQEVRSVCLMRI